MGNTKRNISKLELEPEEQLAKLCRVIPQVPREDLAEFAPLCTFKQYSDKDIILEEGNTRREAFLILKGVVRGYVLGSDGEEKTTLLRSKGIFVGDAKALFNFQAQEITLESVGKSEIALFFFDEFEKLAYTRQNLNKLYIESLKEAIVRLSYRVETMVTMSGEERYLDLLKKNPAFLRDTYDKYVANFLGITPVSLSRIKKRLRKVEINKG